MFIESGDIVSLSHYSRVSSIKTIIVDVQENNTDNNHEVVSIKITKDCAAFEFLADDPVVLGVEKNSDIYITSCRVSHVDPRKGLIYLEIENEEFVNNHRAFERFPVSLYADLIRRDTKEASTAIIKNISFNGLMVCSKHDLEKGQELDFKLYFDKIQISFSAAVIWKLELHSVYEYGFRIVFMEYSQQNVLKHYIEQVKNDQEDFIRSLKNSL